MEKNVNENVHTAPVTTHTDGEPAARGCNRIIYSKRHAVRLSIDFQ